MFRNDLFEFHSTLRSTLHAFVDGWSRRAHNSQDSWELELRLGTVCRSSPQPPGRWGNPQKQRFQLADDHGARFRSAVSEAYFLALFNTLVHSSEFQGTVSPSAIDFVERYSDGQRRRFERDGRNMRLMSVQHKKRTQKPQDFEPDMIRRTRSAGFGFRLASSVEYELPLTHEFDDMRASSSSIFSEDGNDSGSSTASEPTQVPMVKRERRTVIFQDASAWQIDFTRVDDGSEFCIEVELRWPSVRDELRGIWCDRCPTGTPTFDRFLIDTLERDLLNIVDRLDSIDVGYDARVPQNYVNDVE